MPTDDLTRRVTLMEKRMSEATEAISDVRAAQVEHRVRLENGTKVFADVKRHIEAVDARTAPKPPSVLKIVGITISVVLAGAGALWGLANMLRDRPTMEQIHQVMDGHRENGHKATRSEIRAIQTTQTEQKVVIEDIKATQRQQGEKLDSILDRLPEKRSPRKR